MDSEKQARTRAAADHMTAGLLACERSGIAIGDLETADAAAVVSALVDVKHAIDALTAAVSMAAHRLEDK